MSLLEVSSDPKSVREAMGLYDTVADLLAETSSLSEGATVRAEDFRYIVAASGASDHHVTTAGGTKLYVQPGGNGYNVKAFGAEGDGVTDDTAAIQAAVDAIARASYVAYKGGSVFIPRGNYSVTNVNIPWGATASANYIIRGEYGTIIEVDGTDYAFSRTDAEANQTAADVAVNNRLVFESLTFRGSNTTGQGGISVGPSYGSIVRACVFEDLDIGLMMKFCLMARVEMCFFFNCNTYGAAARDGDWTGATTSNSQSNGTVFSQCKFGGKTGQTAQVFVRASQNCEVQDCIFEGANPNINIMFRAIASTNAKNFRCKNIWTENSPTTAHMSIELGAGGVFALDGIVATTSGGTTLEMVSSVNTTWVHITNVVTWSGVIDNENANFYFDGKMPVDIMDAATYWAGGVYTTGTAKVFYNSAGDQSAPTLATNTRIEIAGDLAPDASGTRSFGIFAQKWHDAYFDGDIFATGLPTANSATNDKLWSDAGDIKLTNL